jgi:hypothetical protein
MTGTAPELEEVELDDEVSGIQDEA